MGAHNEAFKLFGFAASVCNRLAYAKLFVPNDISHACTCVSSLTALCVYVLSMYMHYMYKIAATNGPQCSSDIYIYVL